jgi:hypothetical protein
MSADGQEQKLARQIDGHGSSSIWDMTTVVTGPNFAIPQPKSSPPMPYFAIASSASVTFSGRRWGVNRSSNHSKYVSSHT